MRTWIEPRFRGLSPLQPSGQALWLYLLTNPGTTIIPGLYTAGELGMAEALGWEVEAFREAFEEISSRGMAKADWEARVVWVPDAIGYDPPQSPNVIVSWGSAWADIPECDLKREAYRSLRAFTEGLSEAFRQSFRDAVVQPFAHPYPNQEQEQEQEQERERPVPEPEHSRAHQRESEGADSHRGNGKRPVVLNLLASLGAEWDEIEAWWRAEGPGLQATALADGKKPEKLIVPWFRHYLRGEREHEGAAEKDLFRRLHAEQSRLPLPTGPKRDLSRVVRTIGDHNGGGGKR